MENPLVRHGLSLRLTLLAYVIFPLVVALWVADYQSLKALESRVQTSFQAEIGLIARTLQLPLSGPVAELPAPELDQGLKNSFPLDLTFGIHLYDRNGRPLATTGAQPPEPLPAGMLASLARGEQPGGYGQLAGRRVYSHFAPLTSPDGGLGGVLRVSRSASDLQAILERLRREAYLVMFLATLVMGALVLGSHYLAIGRPLERLMATMDRVGRGERSHRTPLEGPQEFAALGAALNAMLDSIDRAEAELARRHRVQADLEKRLQHAERMAALGRLAAGVAHELGTPLSIVDGKAQRLLRHCEGGSPLAESLQDIRREVGRMEQIIRQLLEFGRSQGDRRRSLTVARLAEMAAASVGDAFRGDRTRLEIEPGNPDLTLEVNPMRLEQALVNLLNNARQASPGGTVRLSWQEQPGGVEIRVEDDGPGVQGDLKRQIFEPFFTTKAVGQGSGLGLAIVHSVAREHGGEVEVADSPLGGALFRLTLPVNPDKSHEPTHP